MLFLDELFEMGSGYVLNFSDRTFARFFSEELNFDIDDLTYARQGTSKAKRLRCFLQAVDRPAAIRTLQSLWEYREALRQQSKRPETVENAHGRLLALIDRVSGSARAAEPTGRQPVPAFDRSKATQLKSNLILLTALPPQATGYEFERFLKELFDAFGLYAQEPFRLRGERARNSTLSCVGTQSQKSSRNWLFLCTRSQFIFLAGSFNRGGFECREQDFMCMARTTTNSSIPRSMPAMGTRPTTESPMAA